MNTSTGRRGGRLTRDQFELHEVLESLNFEFVEMDDYLDHLARIDHEMQAEEHAADRRLLDADRRLQRIHSSTREVRILLPAGDAEAVILGHLEVVELEAQGDVIAARRHLEVVRKRRERVRQHIQQLRGHVNHDRRLVLDLTARRGWAGQLRPEVLVEVEGSVATLVAGGEVG